jgi:hypothetical protein
VLRNSFFWSKSIHAIFKFKKVAPKFGLLLFYVFIKLS